MQNSFIKMNPKERESISRSFKKIKEEMLFLYNHMIELREQLNQVNSNLLALNNELKNQKILSKTPKKEPNTYPAHIQQKAQNPADNPYYNKDISPISTISTGNRGVPTDSQQIVNRHPTHKIEEKQEEEYEKIISTTTQESSVDKSSVSDIKEIKIDNLSVILEKLKKDLKQKFKNLTNQEILVFSIIYTLNEELSEVSYKDIALKANLTEGSIRDYVSRLEHKGIPLIKEKKNNKLILIKIPDELKNLTTLDNLTKLNK